MQLLTTFGGARRDALAPAGLELSREAFVFSPDPSGRQPWHPDHFTYAYRALADSLGIPEPLKNLRHFNATQLLAAGVDLRTTAGRLGHSDGGATTLRVYASWTMPVDQKAAELLAADLDALRKNAVAAAGGVPVGPVGQGLLPGLRAPSTKYCRNRSPSGPTLTSSSCSVRRSLPVDSRPETSCPPSERWRSSRLARSTAHRAIGVLAADGTIVRIGRRWTVGHGAGHERATPPSAEA